MSKHVGTVTQLDRRVASMAGLAGRCRAAVHGHKDTDTATLRGSLRSPSIEGIREPTAEQLTCSGSGTLSREAPVARSS